MNQACMAASCVVDGKLDGLGKQSELPGRFDLAHGANRGRGILQGELRRGLGQPFRGFTGVGIAGVVGVRHDGVDVVVALLEFREASLELRVVLDVGEAGLLGDAGICRAHAHAVPALLGKIARRQEKNFGGTFPALFGGVRGNDQERCAFFIVPGEVVETLFLVEDVGGRGVFLAGIAEDDDGRAKFCYSSRARALGEDGIRARVRGPLRQRNCQRGCAQQSQGPSEPAPTAAALEFTSRDA